jgi:hypothetical protein
MRRVVPALISVLLGVGAALVLPASAWADPATCQQYDSHGICIVRAQSDGSAAEPSAEPMAGESDRGEYNASAASCTLDVSAAVVPCRNGEAWWVQSMQCYAEALAEQPARDSPVWGGHTDGAIYLCTFYTGNRAFPGTNGFSFWSATPPAGPPAVDPAVLAEQALATLTLPVPTTGRYPAGTLQDGQPFTVVNAYTWFWTDPESFQPLTARADAGDVWTQVTVEPTSLSFTPGDGSAPASCPGPGVAWQQTDGVWAQSPAGCDYRYPHSSFDEPDRQVTAVYRIQWSVSWTSSTGASGTLPQLTTTSDATFAVAEVQAVVTQ